MESEKHDRILTEETKFDVAIVGGGAAGTACAALLSQKGLRVVLLERRKNLGGRASTLEARGFKLDSGVHGIPCYDLGSLKKIEKELGIKLDLIDYRPLLAFYDAEEDICVEVFDFSIEGFKEVSRIWSPNGEFIKLLNYLKTVSDEEADELDSVSVKDFIQKFSPTHQFYQLIRAINGMITIEPHLGSAGEFVRSFSRLFSSKRPITYPRTGGIQSLSETMAEVAKSHDSLILTSAKVTEVIIKDKIARGVKGFFIDDKRNKEEFTIQASAVIISFPLQDLFKLVPASEFSERFVSKIESLKDKQSCAQGVMFAFKEELLKDMPWDPKCWGAIVFQPGEKPRYLSVPSALVDGVAPPGLHYMFYGIVVTPEEIKIRKDNRARIRQLKKEIYKLFPRLKDLKVWQYEGTSEMVLGTSKRVGMTGKFKPGNVAPDIEGLFFAGDTAGGNGPGLECTYDSALKCSKIVLDWIDEKKKAKNNENGSE
ncbi:MAG: phytoene desaturase family protein [Candidatus Helarchaeales archaeon]